MNTAQLRQFQTTPSGRPCEDPVGHQISLTLKDKTYLGDVMAMYFNHTLGVVVLKVRHFNGEPWPFEPRYSAVTVIDKPKDDREAS